MSTHEQVKRERKILVKKTKKDLFTVGQMCNVCGISRSTALRMESRGLLSPAYCDKKTGYRYYDNHNINKILQINAFLEMGLQYDDILEFYSSGGNSSGILQKLERRSELLTRNANKPKRESTAAPSLLLCCLTFNCIYIITQSMDCSQAII